MADHAATTTVIGPDACITGEMHFEGNARILGTFEGRLTSKGEVQIGEGATCRASIEASRIIIDGLVEGDVVAADRVQLSTHARLVGDLVAGALVVAEGASFSGQCRVGPVTAEPRPAARPTPRAEPKIETKPVRPAAATRPTLPTTPARPVPAEALAAATAELENDPDFKALAGT